MHFFSGPTTCMHWLQRAENLFSHLTPRFKHRDATKALPSQTLRPPPPQLGLPFVSIGKWRHGCRECPRYSEQNRHSWRWPASQYRITEVKKIVGTGSVGLPSRFPAPPTTACYDFYGVLRLQFCALLLPMLTQTRKRKN